MADADRPPGARDEETRWSRVRDRDYGYLVERFWTPVRCYLSRRVPSADDADDLTQELFLSLLRKQFLSRADAGRGSFRALVFHCARQFLVDHYRRQARRAAHEVDTGATDPVTPYDAFSLDWYRSLANQARRDVKAHYLERDKPESYRIFRLYYFGDETPEPWSPSRIAEALGTPVSRVNNVVGATRGLFARKLREAIGAYAETTSEIDEELRELAGLLDRHRLHGVPPSTLWR